MTLGACAITHGESRIYFGTPRSNYRAKCENSHIPIAMTKTIQEMLASADNNTQQPVQYVETVEAYDKWAEVRSRSRFARFNCPDRWDFMIALANGFLVQVYDTDGNFLQRLDTLEMRALLPRFLDQVMARFVGSDQLTLVDLGCGTGRNTIQLLETLALASPAALSNAEVVGLDASPGMLDVARNAIQSAVQHKGIDYRRGVSLGVFDLLKPSSTQSLLPASLQSSGAAGVISTLVLEHIPLKEFFEASSAIMKPGAYLLVTNMHADMGSRSQAGFTDPQTGVKIRPTSYCHSVPDVLAAADKAGFQLEDLARQDGEDGVLERDVDDQLADGLGARAKKWVGVRVWFGVCFSKRG